MIYDGKDKKGETKRLKIGVIMEFNIVGQGDPFLHVTLARGEKLICESDAMVMMESNRIKG